jgi:hypothetical protein
MFLASTLAPFYEVTWSIFSREGPTLNMPYFNEISLALQICWNIGLLFTAIELGGGGGGTL